MLPSMYSNLSYRIPKDQSGLLEAQNATKGEQLGVFPAGTAGTEATEKQKVQPEVAGGCLSLFEDGTADTADAADTADTAERIDDFHIDDFQKESGEAFIHSLLTSSFEDISKLSDNNGKPKEEASSAGNPCNRSCSREYSKADLHQQLEDMEKLIDNMGEPTEESSSGALLAGRSAWKTQIHLARLQAQKSLGYMREQSGTVRQIPERLLRMLADIQSYAEPRADAQGADSIEVAAHGQACVDDDGSKAKTKEIEELLMSCSKDICNANDEMLVPKAEPSANFAFADLGVWKKLSVGQMVSERAQKAKVKMQRSIEYMKEQSESLLRMPEDMALSMRAAQYTSQRGGA